MYNSSSVVSEFAIVELDNVLYENVGARVSVSWGWNDFAFFLVKR